MQYVGSFLRTAATFFSTVNSSSNDGELCYLRISDSNYSNVHLLKKLCELSSDCLKRGSCYPLLCFGVGGLSGTEAIMGRNGSRLKLFDTLLVIMQMNGKSSCAQSRLHRFDNRISG